MGKKATRFSVVRYGNVVGSRGSVIPLFLKLKSSGTLPVTDKKMTRFWITLKESADFVLKSFGWMRGGELFVPKIPSTNIADIAKAIAPECKIDIIGIRPGEKLHELLITKEDGRRTSEYSDHFIIWPNAEYWSSSKPARKDGKPVKEGFEYSSDNNPLWLSFAKTKKLIGKYCRENDKNLLR